MIYTSDGIAIYKVINGSVTGTQVDNIGENLR